jgi:hypothetical protein
VKVLAGREYEVDGDVVGARRMMRVDTLLEDRCSGWRLNRSNWFD